MIKAHTKTTDNTKDRQLLQKIKAGDYHSFKSLFEGYYDVLCNYSLKYINEQFIADDIVQEVFIKIWEKRKSLIIISSVKSYLYTAVKNKCLNRLKAEQVRKANMSLFSAQETKTINHSEIEQEEFRNHLFACIDKLPPRCKEVFLQSRFSDLKQEMIAESLNITIKTVKAQIGKALKLLKTCIQSSYPEFF